MKHVGARGPGLTELLRETGQADPELSVPNSPRGHLGKSLQGVLSVPTELIHHTEVPPGHGPDETKSWSLLVQAKRWAGGSDILFIVLP